MTKLVVPASSAPHGRNVWHPAQLTTYGFVDENQDGRLCWSRDYHSDETAVEGDPGAPRRLGLAVVEVVDDGGQSGARQADQRVDGGFGHGRAVALVRDGGLRASVEGDDAEQEYERAQSRLLPSTGERKSIDSSLSVQWFRRDLSVALFYDFSDSGSEEQNQGKAGRFFELLKIGKRHFFSYRMARASNETRKCS